MKITFVGVGEACDPSRVNTSLLVHYGADWQRHILLDCGFTVPHQYFQYGQDVDALRGVWISHFHGDHFFGLPLLILKLSELGRTTPLLIVGPPGVGQQVEDILALAYGSLSSGAGFKIDYLEAVPGEKHSLAGLVIKTAEVDHGRRALAVRVERGDKALFYSGDGRVTAASAAMAHGVDLLVHEAYTINADIPGHCTVSDCIDLARRGQVVNLALVHIKAQEREARAEELMKIIKHTLGLQLFMPEAGDEFMI